MSPELEAVTLCQGCRKAIGLLKQQTFGWFNAQPIGWLHFAEQSDGHEAAPMLAESLSHVSNQQTAHAESGTA